MLTARDAVPDVVKSLNPGADDRRESAAAPLRGRRHSKEKYTKLFYGLLRSRYAARGALQRN